MGSAALASAVATASIDDKTHGSRLVKPMLPEQEEKSRLETIVVGSMLASGR